MRLDRLSVQDYRNIAKAELSPAPELTVLVGQNGQGKTNLLESIWMLTGGKSFRGSRDAELVRRNAEFAVFSGNQAVFTVSVQHWGQFHFAPFMLFLFAPID